MRDTLQNVDVTSLVDYLERVKDIDSISKMQAPTYLRYFIEGQDVAGVMLARAVQQDLKAKSRLDQAKSIAFLDKASDYLKEKGLKDSQGMREMYVALDEDVIAATDEKARTEAMVALLKNKLSVLRQSHDSLKKIIYGDNSLTNYEGM